MSMSLNKYKYCYAVNLHIQQEFGQKYPTFTPIPRDMLTGEFPRIAGNGMSTVALYYTDESIDFSSEADIEKHTKIVLRGGANIVKPDADDSSVLKRLMESGTFTPDALKKAEMAALEMQAVLAADGHYKFTFETT